MNEGCDWLVQYKTGHKVDCHYNSVNDMVLYHYHSTANVLYNMLKCGLCQPEVQETSMQLNHWLGLGV